MKLTIESTEMVTLLDGVMVRLWRGTSEDGTPCLVFVHRLAVHDNHNASAFAQELLERSAPVSRHTTVPIEEVLAMENRRENGGDA